MGLGTVLERCAWVTLHICHYNAILVVFPNLRVNFGTLDDCSEGGAAAGTTSPAAPVPPPASTTSGAALKTAVQQVFRTMEMENATAYLPLQVRAQKRSSALQACTP